MHTVSWAPGLLNIILGLKLRILVRPLESLNEKGWKNIFHANGNDKKVRVPILISDKIDFKARTYIQEK